MTPITRTYATKFSNGQSAAVRFTADENGIKRETTAQSNPLRMHEISDEIEQWAELISEDFVRQLPDEYGMAYFHQIYG